MNDFLPGRKNGTYTVSNPLLCSETEEERLRNTIQGEMGRRANAERRIARALAILAVALI